MRCTLGCAKNSVAVRTDPFPGAHSCHGEGAVPPPALSALRASHMTASDWLAMILPTCPAPSLFRLRASRGSVSGDHFGPLKPAHSMSGR
jgi:hypothetical protein